MFKKVLIMLMASFLVCAIGSAFGTSSIAAQKNSPTTNYDVFIKGDAIPYYDKVNGKKIGMISYRIGESSNDLLMVKVENDYYSKVKFKKTENGKRKYVGYVKNKDISAIFNSLDNLVVRVSTINLRTKASTKGKVVTQIKRGTQLDIISVNRSETWAKVKYYKNGKKYVGYVSTKYTIYL